MVYEGEDDNLYPLVNEGLTLYRNGLFFEAHELWEYAWGGEVGRNKLTLQALIQIAAALHKHAEGNRRGPSKLLAKARDKITEVRGACSAWLGIDLVALEADVDVALAAADRFARGEIDAVPPPALPEATGPDGILYLHGFASGPSSYKASVLVPPLRADGFHVEVPDLNEGDFERLTISRALALAKRRVRDRTIVIGSSFGGYVATLLASMDDRVKALVLMAPAFDLAGRMHRRYGEEAIQGWKEAGYSMVEHYAFGGEHRIGYGFLEDAELHPLYPKVRVPTYVLQGERDDVVPPETARALAEAHPELVELDLVEDDHGLGSSAERALGATRRMIDRVCLAPALPAADLEAARATVDADPAVQ